MFIRYNSGSFLMMASLGLLMVSAILGQDNTISIVTALPNNPLLYINDSVTIRCNGGSFGDPPPTTFGLTIQGYEQDYLCGTVVPQGLQLLRTDELPIVTISPDGNNDCQHILDNGPFEFVFKTDTAGLTYQCFMFDGTSRTSTNGALPATIYGLPTDTQLVTDGENYYEGSTVTATCTVTGGFPETTTYQYSFAGQTQNVTDAWTFRANRTMTGDISCTSTEHLLYRDRSQLGLVASKTINIYYIDLTSEARGGVEKVLNPEYDNSIDCQEFQDTNLPTRDLTYSWTGDGKTTNEATLRLPKSKASGTVQYMCYITGPIFRAADPVQTRPVVVNVTWSSTAPPPADDGQNASLSTGAIGGIIGGVLFLLVVIICIIVCAKYHVLCFKPSGYDKSGASRGGSSNPKPTENRRYPSNNGPNADLYTEVVKKTPAQPTPAQAKPDSIVYAELDHSGAPRTVAPIKPRVRQSQDDPVIYTQVALRNAPEGSAPAQSGEIEMVENELYGSTGKPGPIKPQRSRRL